MISSEQITDAEPLPMESGWNADIDDQITIELLEKNRLLEEFVTEHSQDDNVINVRIQQLAIAKVLVHVHNRNRFILVKAHSNLGETYLQMSYYEQALEHFSTAQNHISSSLIINFEDVKQYQSYLLMLTGRCYLAMNQTHQAIITLERALELSITIYGVNNLSITNILSNLSQAYEQNKDLHNSIKYLMEICKIAERTGENKGETMAAALLEIARVNMKMKNYPHAIENQKAALSIYCELEGIDPIPVANVGITLSEWCEKTKSYSEAIEALKHAIQIYEYIYGNMDKKTWKIKRSLCTLLLKSNEYDEALEQLSVAEEMEQKLFGNSSMQLGRTLKMIGCIYIMKKEDSRAKDYLLRANSIFYKKKMPRLMRDVQNKLLGISSLGYGGAGEGEGSSMNLNGGQVVFNKGSNSEKKSSHQTTKLRTLLKKRNNSGKRGKVMSSPTAQGAK